jgi:murein DD-endopeptidase MepM/ murein hydrolase activator NlpD
MDQRRRVSRKKSYKLYPSLAPIAVIIIILLFYVFLTTGYHKPYHYDAQTTLSLPKPALSSLEKDSSSPDHGWTTATAHPGDTLASIFQKVGLSRQTLSAVLQDNPHAKALSNIKPEQKIQLLIVHQQLEQLIVPISTTQFLIASRNGKTYSSLIKQRKMTRQNDYLTATVRGSLYGTAKRLNIPYQLIRDMTDIFHWDIDFMKEVRAGDQFTILYEADYIEDKWVSTGDILAVSYTHRGIKHQAIRHVNASGDSDYFTPEGTSLKKAFSRYPVQFSHISSTYSLSRYHPILHYRRPHKGVDLAAPIGTPIRAVGDGRIEVIERHNGYGNMIKISHSKQYASLYAHLLKFQKGLARGAHVKRGQVIGYVGQTGLADGPHCHFEFHVNQHPKNPSTLSLPRATPVPKRDMAAFQAKANTLIAQLNFFEETSLASSGKKPVTTA